MKNVSRFEANLLHLLHFFLQQAPWQIEHYAKEINHVYAAVNHHQNAGNGERDCGLRLHTIPLCSFAFEPKAFRF